MDNEDGDKDDSDDDDDSDRPVPELTNNALQYLPNTFQYQHQYRPQAVSRIRI